jgi:hypothetical protein
VYRSCVYTGFKLQFGGIANAVWGRPCATRDADFKILTGDFSIDQLVDLIGSHFKYRTSDPHRFAETLDLSQLLARYDKLVKKIIK